MRQSDLVFIKIRRTLIYTLAVFVVTAAVLLSVARVLLPEIQGYKENIEQKLAELLEQNVRISSVDARLVGFTPTIVLKGVKLIDDSGVKELLSFREAHLGISVVQSVIQKTLVPSDFTVVGTTLSILQNQDGSYMVQGFDLSELNTDKGFDNKISEELASWLLEQSSISIKESTVVFRNKHNSDWKRFEKVNLVLHNRDQRHQLTGSFSLPNKVGKDSKIAMDVYGDLLEPEQWRGLVYLNCEKIRFSQLGIRPEIKHLKIIDGVADYELWGEWKEGGFHQVSGNVAIHDAQIKNTKTKKISRIDELKGDFDWRGTSSDWKLKIDRLSFETQGSAWKESALVASWSKTVNNNSRLRLALSYAKIDDARRLLLKSGLYHGEGAKMLAGLSPVGEIRNLDINYIQSDKDDDKYAIKADVSHFGMTAWQKIPGIYGINAKINLADNYGRIEIKGENTILNVPRLFREHLSFGKIDSSFDVINSGSGWVLQTDNFKAENQDFKLKLGLLLMLPNKTKARYMDMQAAVSDVDITKIYKFQPTVLMKEKLVKWIDNSFIKGRVPEIRLAYRGWSNKFPFRDKSGALNVYFKANDVEMNYFPGWPHLENLDAEGEFTEHDLHVWANKATIHNGDIKNLNVTLGDYHKPIMFVKGDAYSTTHDGFHFFSKTPVGKRAKRFVSQTRFGGDIHTYMTFSLALDKELAKKYKKRYSGYVETSNGEMHMMRDRMDVVDIKGRVYFSSKKHHGENITAKVLQGDARISVSSKIIGVKPVMEIRGEGKFDAVMLDRRFKKLGMMRVNGMIPWKGKLTLGHQKANGEGRVPAKMRLESDLVGVGIDLPEPFKKSPETVRHSVMRLTFLPNIKSILNIQYGNRMSTEMRMNNNYFPARIEIGEMKLSSGKAKLPDKDEFRLSGVVNNMDQYTWREVMQEHYNKYHKLRTRPIVDVPVIVDFAYVNVPFDKSKAKPRKRYASPLIMPAFKGQVRRFVFAGKEFGKVEFDSRRDKLGLAFDKIRVTSKYMEYNGKFTWHYIDNRHKTKMKGELKTPNLGNLMDSLGFPDKVEDGEGDIKLELNWDSPFYVFRPGYTNGRVELELEDGVVTAVNPGAGRFLGLLNLSTLPRRLLLDFNDVGSGFGFDTMTGIINLKNGIASTKDISIDSTVADILAVGKVDLRKKEFDQIVTVTPQVAGTMPIVSGLLMGTGVIPLVWLFERMFGSDMDKSISRQYHITGPWKTPKVERIDKEEKAEKAVDDGF